MEIIEGKSVSTGVAIGKIFYFSKANIRVGREEITDIDAEIERFEEAKRLVKIRLKELQGNVLQVNGMQTNASWAATGNVRSLFEAHAMLIDDEQFSGGVVSTIMKDKVNAEYAVDTVGKNLAQKLKVLNDEYISARADDIIDVSGQLIRTLQDELSEKPENYCEDYSENINEPVIIVADNLMPSDTVKFDKKKVLAIVTRRGSVNSHASIFARTLGIPAIISEGVYEDWNGLYAVVDATNGKIILEPDEGELHYYRDLQKGEANHREFFNRLKGQEDITRDGKKILLYANIDKASDVDDVLANDAAGIGLYRSEYLYLSRDDYPTEEVQFEEYKSVALKMDGRKVIIRTMDIGADKSAGYFFLKHEDNPAMGYRAVRLCLDRIDVFKTQLRAIYRASAFGNVAVMIPMIISVDEVTAVKKLCAEVRDELVAEDKAIGTVEIGIMIETPAAAMISDLLAEEVDFFSIGTNDLTQFTLAVDRQNADIGKLYDAHHEAVLRMIKMVAENAKAKGRRVGICGELATDTQMTEKLIQMGIDELSVPASSVLEVRKAIRESSSKA